MCASFRLDDTLRQHEENSTHAIAGHRHASRTSPRKFDVARCVVAAGSPRQMPLLAALVAIFVGALDSLPIDAEVFGSELGLLRSRVARVRAALALAGDHASSR